MTSQEKNLLQDIARKPLGSIWGYWAFAFPVLIVIIGIAVQAFLLAYFKQHSTGFEVCIRQGDKVDVLWDSQLVQQAVLTVSLSITATFGLLAFLARQSYKQIGLLKSAARELGIENGQPPAAPHGGPATQRGNSAITEGPPSVS